MRAGTEYELDAADTVVATGAGWDQFADGNGGDRCHAVQVHGQPLWHFVAGSEARASCAELFAAARSRLRPVSVPFRCDAPGCRRHMELTVNRTSCGGLRVRTRLLAEHTRTPVAMLDAALPRSSDRLLMCSWCKRVRAAGGGGRCRWLEPEDYVKRFPPVDARQPPRLAHEVCPACRRRLHEL